MSRESRLARLGLLHLKDKPEELQAIIRRDLDERDREVEAYNKELQAKIRANPEKYAHLAEYDDYKIAMGLPLDDEEDDEEEEAI